ncbi:hypothetical protein F4782DRAFT_521924 [Xylaria castorea]|nr:hypothetical protein F4782DRAFT_521924 [Xylaria castorea]
MLLLGRPVTLQPKKKAMLQHRRTLTIILAALSLICFYRLRFKSPDHSPPSWIRPGQDGEDVLNSTLGFAEIFVINLPSRRDRRDAMTMAGAVSNLNLTFLDGLTGDDSVAASSSTGKSTNAGTKPSHSASAGARGSWHSHMNAMQTIVAQDLGSALVLEDDVDWDVRLKTQMGTFAQAARMWLDAEEEKRRRVSGLRNLKTTARSQRVGRWLVGLVPSSSSEGVEKQGSKAESPTGPDSSSAAADDRRAIEEGSERDTISLSPNLHLNNLGRGTHAQSPYGDDWDVLWLGHCGADLPTARRREPLPPSSSREDQFSPSSSSSSSSLTISIPDDETVPAPKHLKPHPFALHDKLSEAYPAHTRIVHAADGNVCSLAYAVSRTGARKLLRRFGRDGFVDQWDLMLRDYCMGEYEDRGGDGSGKVGDEEEEEGGNGGPPPPPPVCLTVQPPLISHHYAGEEGASVSNIRGQGGGFARGKKGTPYVRLSVQENLSRLVAGFPVYKLIDQLPDDGDPLW